ncbi:MAG: membrane protein insertion efficiency factor YidD [Rhizomicrobium sp.]
MSTVKDRRGVAAGVLIAPIRFYRAFLSPFFPPACRFQPTCSQYAIEAIQTHGALKGAGLVLRRLARCHPISWLGGSSGFDPVPPGKFGRPDRSCR